VYSCLARNVGLPVYVVQCHGSYFADISCNILMHTSWKKPSLMIFIEPLLKLNDICIYIYIMSSVNEYWCVLLPVCSRLAKLILPMTLMIVWKLQEKATGILRWKKNASWKINEDMYGRLEVVVLKCKLYKISWRSEEKENKQF